MCIKIIGPENSQEFNPSEPLELQVDGANEIFVNYEPSEKKKIKSFVNQMERFFKTGISLNLDIKVNVNNSLDGMRLERIIEDIKRKLDVNEIAKGLSRFHTETDRKLSEMAEMCLEKNDEY